MIKTKFDFSRAEKSLESRKELKREFDKAVHEIALEVFEEARKYFLRTSLFYNCPNIMRRMGKAIPKELLKMIKNDPYFNLRIAIKPMFLTRAGIESAAELIEREFKRSMEALGR